MALDFLGRTKIKRSKEIPVQTGEVVTDEGMALVRAMENGEEVVKPATGGDGSEFKGFSYGHVFTPATLSLVEEYVVPDGGGEVKVAKMPLSGQYMVFDVTDSVELTETTDSVGAVSDGTYYLDDRTFTFDSAQGGHTVKIQYRYSPLAFEIMMQSNINIYTTTPTEYLGSIGVIELGDVYTNMFDASVNWMAATGVKLASGGLFTDHNGDGETIPVTITHYPSTDEPYLGLSL